MASLLESYPGHLFHFPHAVHAFTNTPDTGHALAVLGQTWHLPTAKSGLEALKILRKHPTTAHIPVIAISANALPLDIEKGLRAGLFLYYNQTHQGQRVQ
jgi:CheY-like chemotaxis protein